MQVTWNSSIMRIKPCLWKHNDDVSMCKQKTDYTRYLYIKNGASDDKECSQSCDPVIQIAFSIGQLRMCNNPGGR